MLLWLDAGDKGVEEVYHLFIMDSVNDRTYGNYIEIYDGDVIRVKRGIYWHYGIVLSKENVVHYSSYPSHWWKKRASIRIVSLQGFLKKKRSFQIYYRADSYKEREKIVYKALNRIGEERYSLLFNNCKMFVDDCII